MKLWFTIYLSVTAILFFLFFVYVAIKNDRPLTTCPQAIQECAASRGSNCSRLTELCPQLAVPR